MFDPVAKARYNAWKQLGKLSRIEAMVMYAQAIEDVSPRWWAWPPLGFVPAAEGEEDAAEPAEGAEDGEDADAKLYVESAEALKDIVDAALKVSGLQVRNSSMLRCLHITSP